MAIFDIAHAGALRPPAHYPTEPSSLRLMSAFTSSANSSGSLLKTSAQKPLMMMLTACSGSMPLCTAAGTQRLKGKMPYSTGAAEPTPRLCKQLMTPPFSTRNMPTHQWVKTPVMWQVCYRTG